MNIYLECIPCFLNQSIRAVRSVTDDQDQQERVVRYVLSLLAELELNRPPPYVGRAIYHKVGEVVGNDDPYREHKRVFNRMARAITPELEFLVKRAPDPLLAAIRLAIAANMIDLGTPGTFTEDEVHEALMRAKDHPVAGDLEAFRESVSRAKEILYLADNAGEIAIDRLLVQQLGPERVTVAVRGRAVSNDATLADAREVGLDTLVEVIDNGSDAPGTILDECSEPFRERFRRADLIISKGQGNFETLSETEGNIFFLFKVKCPVAATHSGMPLGTHALVRGSGT